MLRFRPIAPKPVHNGEPITCPAEDHHSGIYLTSASGRPRAKRKYVRKVRGRGKSSNTVKRKKADGEKPSPSENSGIEDQYSPPEKRVVTLQLLPERSEAESNREIILGDKSLQKVGEDSRISVGNVDRLVPAGSGCATARFGRSGSRPGTLIIVEGVIGGKWSGEGGLGFGSDAEKINDLERDTCPGFVSDGRNNVIWVNEACRKMVGAKEEEEEEERGVSSLWLAVKAELPKYPCCFACRVRVVHGQNWKRVVGGDAWRMENGGCAWKLDVVNTSLSLGLNYSELTTVTRRRTYL